MNFHNPWETSTFGTNGVSPFPPFAIGQLQAAVELPDSRPGLSGQDSFGRNFKAGMTQAWNVSVEQQLSNTMAVRVAYVGSESYHQSYVQDDNFAGYSYCTSYTSQLARLRRLAPAPVAPYSNFSGILEYDSGATADYHSLQATFQRHMSHGLQAQSSFTWQKTMDVASSANIAASQNGIDDPRNLRWSRGVSSASIPFTWTTNFIYRTPELSGQNLADARSAGRMGDSAPFVNWQSGAPFSIGSGSSQSAYGEPGYGGGCLQFCAGDRADRVPGVPLKVRQGGRSQWEKQYFNPAAFVARHDGTFGDSARDMMYGPPSFNIDASLMKNWSIHGTVPAAVPLRVLQRLQPPRHGHSGYVCRRTPPLARSTAAQRL